MEGRSPTPMPTTKDRTPAAWRSQVPPRVRPLAAVAADLGGYMGTKGEARGPYRQGTHFKGTEAYRRGRLETLHRSQTVPTLSDTR